MGRVLGVLVRLVLIGGLVAGCGPVEGQASQVGQTGVGLPPRPRDVRIDGVDPCSLLTENQRVDLGLGVRQLYSSKPSPLHRGEVPLCTLSGFSPRAIALTIGVVTTAGIDLYAGGDLDADISSVLVQGFPAVTARSRRFADSCTVAVDVAPGQLLDVQLADGGGEPPIPQSQLCVDAEQAAGAAMATLLAR